MQNQSITFFGAGSSGGYFSGRQIGREESIITTCSSGVESNDKRCFTDSACCPANPVSNATGQLQWKDLSLYGKTQNVSGKRWATAFFIAPHLIMTAGHCFDVKNGIKKARTPFGLTSEQLAPLFKLNMNYAYQSCQPTSGDVPENNEDSIEIIKLHEHRLGNLDYAIAEVEGIPGNNYGYVMFDFSFNEGNIFIPQHPKAEPKKQEYGFGRLCHDQRMIKHNVNTLPGSSGSALSTSHNFVCGVHVRGIGKGMKYNAAVHINTIRAHSPIINGLFNYYHPTIPMPLSTYDSKSTKKTEKDFSNLLVAIGMSGIVGGGALTVFSNNKTTKIAGIAALLVGIAVTILAIRERESAKKENNNEQSIVNAIYRL